MAQRLASGMARLAGGIAAALGRGSSAAVALERTSEYLGKHSGVRRGANALLAGGGTAAAAAACTEEVPYGQERRTRLLPPSWLALVLPPHLRPPSPSADELFEQAPGLREQWGATGRQLAPVQPGEVQFTWVQPQAGEAEQGELPPWVRPLLEDAVRHAAQAVAAEVEDTGFGAQTLEWGWHIVVTPSLQPVAVGMAGNVVILSAGSVWQLLDRAPTLSEGVANLMWTFAHEAGHAVLRHLHERNTSGVAGGAIFGAWAADLLTKDEEEKGRTYLACASFLQQRLWQHEFEADEFATAVLVRLQVPLGQLAGGLRATLAGHQAQAGEWVKWGEDLLRQDQERGSTAMRQLLAGMLSCAPAEVELELPRILDPDVYVLSNLWLGASMIQQKAQELAAAQAAAAAEGPGSTAAAATASPASPEPAPKVILGSPVVGLAGEAPILLRQVANCPEAVRHAYLAKLSLTHPLSAHRIARIDAVARTDAMLQRYAATPPAGAASTYLPGRSVAEILADRARPAVEQAAAEAAQQAQQAEQAGAAAEARPGAWARAQAAGRAALSYIWSTSE